MLSDKLKTLLLHSVGVAGTYDPYEVLPRIEEMLTADETKTATAFLGWLFKHDLKFGHGNIDERFLAFEQDMGPLEKAAEVEAMNERRYVYGIRLTDGRYVHAEGVDIADAMRSMRLRADQVRRYMSVKAIPTVEEVEATRKRIEALKVKKGEKHEADLCE